MVPIVSFAILAIRNEPPHIHVERDDKEVKFWLQPVRLQQNKGFSSKEINRIQSLVEENQEQLLEKWHDFFDT